MLLQKKLIEAIMASFNITNFYLSLNSCRRVLDPNGELLLGSRHYVLRHGTHSCCYKWKSVKEEGRKRRLQRSYGKFSRKSLSDDLMQFVLETDSIESETHLCRADDPLTNISNTLS